MINNDLKEIQDCLNGNQDAYASLVRRHEPRIRQLMWRFARNECLCEELTQDVFVEAYLSLAKYKATGPFLNWLWRIATRVGYRYWKQQTKQSQTVPLPDESILAEATPDSTDPQLAAEILTGLLSRLKPPERLILTLQYFENQSLKQIADHMGWNTAVVKMRAHRARKKLKQIAIRENLLEKLQWMN